MDLIKAFTLYLLVLCCVYNTVSGKRKKQKSEPDIVRSIFVDRILETVGKDSISEADVLFYYEKYQIHYGNDSVEECFGIKGDKDGMEACLKGKCLAPSDVFELSRLGTDNSEEEVTTFSTIILHVLRNNACNITVNETDLPAEEAAHHDRPSSGEAWGFSILATSLMAVVSMTGVIGLPFIHGDTYKKVLLYMVGLAVGTLAGSSLLFLIPEALELTEQELNEYSYVWKCLIVISSIYIFFNVEWILKIITDIREKKARSKMYKPDLRHRRDSNPMDLSTFHLARPVSEYREEDAPNGIPFSAPETPTSGMALLNQEVKVDRRMSDEPWTEKLTEKRKSSGELSRKKSHTPHRHIEPVAWMIVIGDGIHNFIDGVSIGAAFTESILAGVSVSVAILCEEFPHELGDFAILLKAGMNIKQAVIYNLLSACACYVGMVVGIFVGENTAAHTWVFAFAAGMFLYISLVDMMPEMTSAVTNEENQKLNLKLVFLLQNLGMLTGFGVMLLLAVYGGQLEESIQHARG